VSNFKPPFENQVVLITGAASGFGKILAEKLSAQGAKLVLGDINVTGVQEVANSLGDHCIALGCDVTKEADVKALSDAAIETFGRLDIAVNNAGSSSHMKSLLEVTEEELDFNFNVNAKSVFFGIKHQVPHMIKQGGGCILNVASMAGIKGAAYLTGYVAAKHAVVGITRTAALEFATHNIRINAVCPFFSPTPLVTKGIKPEYIERAVKGNPMKRLGSPDEMVNAMLSIIAPDNTYLTGQAIAVDGGVSA
jgi:NAD(P)-dependent dehydrogenase (short-subunit alcohol dehydrogenase family)